MGRDFIKGDRLLTAVRIEKVKKDRATVIVVFGRRFVYDPKKEVKR